MDINKDSEVIEAAAAVLDALNNETRQRIVTLLMRQRRMERDELLKQIIGCTQSNLSNHLKVLKEARLIEREDMKGNKGKGTGSRCFYSARYEKINSAVKVAHLLYAITLT